jgi:signal transduction histidine kinase
MTMRTPTAGLLAGLAVTLSAVAVYSGFTIYEMRTVRALQASTIDRNRLDSHLLLRIQNDLNLLGLTMRDMLDSSEPYPLTAWQAQLKRIRFDLDDALRKHRDVSADTTGQRRYLTSSVAQFWDAFEDVLALARNGREDEARTRVRLSLQARQASLTTAVARLLVQNNESDQQAEARAREIYTRAERNVYFFLAAMVLLIVGTSLYLVQYNRRMFDRVDALSRRRSELARQLISIQENTLRYISRELHDEFGQILTAIGAMLQRVDRRSSALEAPFRADLQETRDIVKGALENIRSMSQALHPVVIEDAGLDGALSFYLPVFEKQTGVQIQFTQTGESRPVDPGVAIHLYRVLQEALNNVARHSQSSRAEVRLRYLPDSLVLEVEDRGIGFKSAEGQGLGLTSMRERSELVNGRIEFLPGESGGALVRLTVPAQPEETHVEA